MTTKVAGRHAAMQGALSITALAGFAVTQPILDLLARSSAFLVAHRADGWTIVGLTALAIIIPATTGMLAWPLARSRGAVGQFAFLLLMTVSVAAICLPVLTRASSLPLSDSLEVALAFALGAVFAAAYRRLEPIRMFSSFLVVAPLIFAIVFLSHSEIRQLLIRDDFEPRHEFQLEGDTPVFFIVLDELPQATLMASDTATSGAATSYAAIDERRFPHFAALAANSHWFVHALSVFTVTDGALPAMLTGRYAPAERAPQPTFESHPDNLFTWLAGAADLSVAETFTQLCPPEVCAEETEGTVSSDLPTLLADVSLIFLHHLLPPTWTRQLPPVTGHWRDFWQAAPAGAPADDSSEQQALIEVRTFRDFIARISPPRDRPKLYFLHIKLPHWPWRLLPTLQYYNDAWTTAGWNYGDENRWHPDPWFGRLGYQRMALQLQATDQLLGELIAELKHQDLYDRSLFVLTADHGHNFRPGGRIRGAEDSTALIRDVLPVPLWVKLPFQQQANLETGLVETIDILPTIAELLNSEVPWHHDGRSLFSAARRRPEETAVRQIFGVDDPSLLDTLTTARFDAVTWKDEHFANGDSFYHHRDLPNELLGRQVDQLNVREADAFTVLLDRPEQYSEIEPEGNFLPAHLIGKIVDGSARSAEPLAVAVNGKIRALTRGGEVQGQDRRFTVMLPPESFHRGDNQIDVLRIGQDARGNTVLERGSLSSSSQWLGERFGESGRALAQLGGSDGFAGFEALHQVELAVATESGQPTLNIDAAGGDPALLLPEIGLRSDRVWLEVELTVPAATEARVFFHTAAESRYWWRQSVRQHVPAGRHRLYFELRGDDVLGRLRFDPGTAPGRYQLHGVKVRTE